MHWEERAAQNFLQFHLYLAADQRPRCLTLLSRHTNLSRWVTLKCSLRLLSPKPRLSLVGLVLSRRLVWLVWICETMPRREAHVGVAQTALRRLLHFAALYIRHLSFMRLQHGRPSLDIMVTPVLY